MTRTAAQVLFLPLRPLFPVVQRLVQAFGFMREAKTVEGPHRRQPYLVGRCEPGNASSVIDAFRASGFKDECIALNENGQLVSLRRLDDAKPDHQYHVRVFNDGEVRGHYELTPEDHPFGHWDERVFEERNAEFVAALPSITLHP